jgi:hypothetical protein
VKTPTANGTSRVNTLKTVLHSTTGSASPRLKFKLGLFKKSSSTLELHYKSIRGTCLAHRQVLRGKLP